MKRRLLLTILLAFAVGTAACGDDDDDPAGNNGNNGADVGTDDTGTDDTGTDDAGTDDTGTDDTGTDDTGTDDTGTDDTGTDDTGTDDTGTDDTGTDADASLSVDDQFLEAESSDTITVTEVVSDDTGWVVIRQDDDGDAGDILGFAGVSDGTNSDVIVGLDRDVEDGETLHAALHTESEPGEEPLEFDESEDTEQLDDNDEPIATTFTVTLPEVTADDQTLTDAESVSVASARSNGPGWLVIYENDCATGGDILGYTAVDDGDNSDVEVQLDSAAEDGDDLCAKLHLDDPEDDDFTFEDESTEDIPASLATSGEVIEDNFTVELDE